MQDLNISLAQIATTPPTALEKKEIKEKTKENIKAIEDLQHVLMAQKKYSLLIILQGMDASGKDSAIRKVFKEISPSGIKVESFKKPTDKELAHDFLWRVHQHTPEKGMIQVFNRSHYEDVLIQRVHGWIDEKTVRKRFKHISNFEELLKDFGTRVLKFYLHTSKEKQLIELEERKTDPTKHWKHNPNDFVEREHWDEYMNAYEDIFKFCGLKTPWHIIPSDQNWYKEYLISEVVKKELASMDLQYPPLEEG